MAKLAFKTSKGLEFGVRRNGCLLASANFTSHRIKWAPPRSQVLMKWKTNLFYSWPTGRGGIWFVRSVFVQAGDRGSFAVSCHPAIKGVKSSLAFMLPLSPMLCLSSALLSNTHSWHKTGLLQTNTALDTALITSTSWSTSTRLKVELLSITRHIQLPSCNMRNNLSQMTRWKAHS